MKLLVSVMLGMVFSKHVGIGGLIGLLRVRMLHAEHIAELGDEEVGVRPLSGAAHFPFGKEGLDVCVVGTSGHVPKMGLLPIPGGPERRIHHTGAWLFAECHQAHPPLPLTPAANSGGPEPQPPECAENPRTTNGLRTPRISFLARLYARAQFRRSRGPSI
jgi:hypothetical protein